MSSVSHRKSYTPKFVQYFAVCPRVLASHHFEFHEGPGDGVGDSPSFHFSGYGLETYP